ncbi:hypothetical protein [Desulfurobacterium sp.]
MEVSGGKVEVLQSEICFAPQQNNIYAPSNKGLTSVKPLNLIISISSEDAHLVKLMFIKAIALKEKNSVILRDGTKLSLSPAGTFLKLKTYKYSTNSGSSYKITLEKAKAISNAMQDKARYTTVEVMLNGKVFKAVPSPDGLILKSRIAEIFFDMSECLMIRRSLYTILAKKIKKLYFDKRELFKIECAEEVIRGEKIFDIERTYILLLGERIPLNKDLAVKLLSVF